MKTYFYFLALMLLTLSCKSDDDADQNLNPTLIGSWSLVNVSGGFAGVDDDFNDGVILWNFTNNPSEITITNTNTTEVVHSGYPSGTYSYEIETTPNDTIVVIENTDLRIISLTTNQLILDEGMVSDGFQYTFNK
ncbi:hypothetical protein [Winogradskyella sediminis]|uniref:Lipocalin-like domain-containing protein n=1 Tax=Winogradskyella sediminis TaxID=1382466 RepID=A0A1H1SJ26_9FLAO|nr:hypothetical protein [Winogradskyella sediminis]REG89226.1 hypothetical protein C8N41_101465 [Winogradskyella sediminis]SDS47987.1 hypothetical protein SAMN04489797_1689 [Winogradskyella sediminis]